MPIPTPTPTFTPPPGPVETLVYVVPTDDGLEAPITWSNSDNTGKKTINLFPRGDFTGFTFYVYNPSISPDGRYLAAMVNGAFSVINLQTNESSYVDVESLGVGAGWHPGSWSPDSSKLVVSYFYQLLIWDATTRQTRRFEAPYIDLMPAWSPNGEIIAFTRYNDSTFDMSMNGLGQLCVMHLDGSDLRVLSEQAFFQGITTLDNVQSLSNILSWSPDGQWIVFLSGDPPDIAIVNVQTGETRLLAPDPTKDVNPSWSPDGTRIAFASNRNGRDQIFSIEPDGSDLLLLTADLIDGNAYAPVWSPLGAHIAFLTWDQKVLPNGLYVMNADGSGKVFIRGDVASVWQRPAWSPIPAP
jgi:Tol biopolymer transport system component